MDVYTRTRTDNACWRRGAEVALPVAQSCPSPNPSRFPVSHRAFTHTVLSRKDQRITTYRTDPPETGFSTRRTRAGDGNSDPAPYATGAIRLYTDPQPFYGFWEPLPQERQHQLAPTSAQGYSQRCPFRSNPRGAPQHRDGQRDRPPPSRVPNPTVAWHARRNPPAFPGTGLARPQSNPN